jgi:hypothetical protein
MNIALTLGIVSIMLIFNNIIYKLFLDTSGSEQGEKGRTGPEGPIGPMGKIGPHGPKGDIGPRGLVGPIGLTGPIGPTGKTGPHGPKGDIGPRGLVGPKGDIGPKGPHGPKGDIGLRGPRGLKGEHGPRGKKGETGPKGAQGPRGVKGPQGVKGQQGQHGGPPGPRGPRGPPGKVTGGTVWAHRLNAQGGRSEHNPHNWGTHFPWHGDNKNYIRGDTEIRGNTNHIGHFTNYHGVSNFKGGKSHLNPHNWGTHFPGTDGKNYIRGNTEIRGNTHHIGEFTNTRSSSNFKGGKSKFNPNNWDTHFPWNGDGKNYIRGDTEMRGDITHLGHICVPNAPGYRGCMGHIDFRKLNALSKNIDIDKNGFITFKNAIKLNNILYIKPLNNQNRGYEYAIYGWDGGGKNQWIEMSKRHSAHAPGRTPDSIKWQKTSLRVNPNGYGTS